MTLPLPMHTRRIHSHLTRCLITSLQPTKGLPLTTQLTPHHYAAYSTKRGSTGPTNSNTNTRTIKSSRDSSTTTSPTARYRRGGQGQQTISDLRRTVMDEVAIPGRFQQYFRPDKRAIRKAEGSVLSMDRSRSPKKVSAAKWSNHFGSSDDSGTVADVEGVGADGQETAGSHAEGSRASSRRGFDNVGWRALEETYARDVLPHPYFHQDYLNVTEIKLLPDRKTFQLWYRPQPDDRVSADEIVEVVTKHASAFKAMLSRHAPRSSSASNRLVFQLVRQSDRQAHMPDLWRRIEEQVDLHSGRDIGNRRSSDDNGLVGGDGEKQEADSRIRRRRR